MIIALTVNLIKAFSRNPKREPCPSGSKYLILLLYYHLLTKIVTYHPKPEYLIIGSFGVFSWRAGAAALEASKWHGGRPGADGAGPSLWSERGAKL